MLTKAFVQPLSSLPCPLSLSLPQAAYVQLSEAVRDRSLMRTQLAQVRLGWGVRTRLRWLGAGWVDGQPCLPSLRLLPTLGALSRRPTPNPLCVVPPRWTLAADAL